MVGLILFFVVLCLFIVWGIAIDLGRMRYEIRMLRETLDDLIDFISEPEDYED